MTDAVMSLWPLLNQAENLIQQGDQRAARAQLEQAMMLAGAAGDPWMEALTYIRSATTDVRLGEIERALLYYDRGIDVLRGRRFVPLPPPEAAHLLPLIQDDLASPEMTARPRVRGAARLTGGMTARRTGRLDLAEAELRSALPLLAQDGDRVNHEKALLELAVVLDESRRYAESEPF